MTFGKRSENTLARESGSDGGMTLRFAARPPISRLLKCKKVLRSEARHWTSEIWAEEEEAALSSSSPPPLTCYANRLSSLVPSRPIVQLPRRICFQLAALLKRGIQYIERDFACIWFRSFSGGWKPGLHAASPSLPALSGSQGTPTL